VSPDRNEEIEVDVGSLGPTYDDTRCCMDPDIVYKWVDIYQIFQQDTYPMVSFLPSDVNPHDGIYYVIKHP